MNIKTTLETSQAILLLRPWKWLGLFYSSLTLLVPLSIFIITIYHFLLNHSFTFPRLSLRFVIINLLCPGLVFFPHLIISSSSITVLHPRPLYHHLHSCHHRNHYSALLHYHSSYIFSSSPHLSSLPSAPGSAFPRLHHPHHHPDHLPHSPRGAVFVCVGCTVLYKCCMLMQQKAAEHYGEWTNFRSAWPRFITAHKPKVSWVRWRGKSVPRSTRIIYHPAPVGSASPSCFLPLLFKRNPHAALHLYCNLCLSLVTLS